MDMSALREAIDHVGGVSAAAKICQLTPRGIYKWLGRGYLPRTEYTGETRYAEALAAASDGAFSASWLLDEAHPRLVNQSMPSAPSKTAS